MAELHIQVFKASHLMWSGKPKEMQITFYAQMKTTLTGDYINY